MQAKELRIKCQLLVDSPPQLDEEVVNMFRSSDDDGIQVQHRHADLAQQRRVVGVGDVLAQKTWILLKLIKKSRWIKFAHYTMRLPIILKKKLILRLHVFFILKH